MDTIPQIRIVRFDLYCPKCKHFEEDDNEFPCDECLSNPGNYDTRQPVLYEEK